MLSSLSSVLHVLEGVCLLSRVFNQDIWLISFANLVAQIKQEYCTLCDFRLHAREDGCQRVCIAGLTETEATDEQSLMQVTGNTYTGFYTAFWLHDH